ncbi:MAG TPA: hypothetical protein VNI78_08260 [Vicinamibacterales bacterium]|nr:hypothetical protein [Vicinamibacterales bacterium]
MMRPLARRAVSGVVVQYRPGDRVTVLVARRERLMPLTVTLAAEPPRRWRLEIDPAASAEQKARLAAWPGEG